MYELESVEKRTVVVSLAEGVFLALAGLVGQWLGGYQKPVEVETEMVNSPIRWGVVSITCLLIVLGEMRDAVADVAAVTRFFEDAPRKWAEYRLLLRGFELRSESTTELVLAKSEEGVSERVVCGRDGMRALRERRPRSTGQNETIYGSNPDYSFELIKTGAANAAFSISDLSPCRSGEGGIALRNVAGQAGLICRAHPLDFSKIVSSPAFRVKDATETTRDGMRLVRIEFQYNLKNPGPEERLLATSYTGTACFAPDLFWAITDAKMEVGGDPRKEVGGMELRYGVEKGFRGVPAITEGRVSWFSPGGSLVKRITFSNRWSEFADDDNVFTLSAYGFPEPRFSQPTKGRLWVLCLSAALLVLSSALLVYRRYSPWRRT